MPSFPDEKAPIGTPPRLVFFDSGIGGIAYLEAFSQRNPDVISDYIADTAFFPFGERDPEEVESRVLACFRAIPPEASPDLAVLACNTASVVALKKLRTVVDYPVVGVVPAVKPAAARTKSGHLAILSTNRTANDPYTRELVATFARYYQVHALGLPELVDRAERSFCDDTDLLEEIRGAVVPRIPASVDTVVLACTHFVRYRRSFERALGDRVTVVDSLDGVVRRIEHLLGRSAAAPGEPPGAVPSPWERPGGGRGRFYATASTDAVAACIRERFDIYPLAVPLP